MLTIGALLRKKLNLRPQKSHGVYVLPLSDRSRLEQLYGKLGLKEAQPEVQIVEDDLGALRDIERDPIRWY